MARRGSRAAKDRLYDRFASVARALGSGRRAEIVDLLAQGERSVEEIAAEIDQSVANTSHHLRALARAELVTSRPDGRRVWYRLASERVGELSAALRDVAVDQLGDTSALVDAYLGDRATIEAVTAEELATRIERGRAVVVDVRPRPEYEAGHIAGARSLPLDELRADPDALPRSREVVAYCRGPYCIYADDAVRLLRRRGYRARRLDVGYPEWRRAGRPVERGARSA